MKHIFRCEKAQNMIEYVLLFTAVVVVMIGFLARNGSYYQSVNNVLKQPLNMMDMAKSKDFK